MTSDTSPLRDGDAANPPQDHGCCQPRSECAAKEPRCWRPTGATAA